MPYLITLLCVLCFVPQPARAEDTFWVEAEIGSVFGQTDFELEIEGIDRGNDIRLRSLLEWPVDFVLVGSEFGARFNELWFAFRLHTNLGDARGTMDDSDYVSSKSANLPPTRFAFTKSETTSRVVFAELLGGLDLLKPSNHFALGLIAGYRHEHYALSAFGGSGTYLDEDGNPTPVFVSSSIRVVDYDVDHMLPFAGMVVTLTPNENVRLPLFARAYVLHSRSRDDHVMRKKIATGISNGAGVSVAAFPSYALNEHWAIGLAAEYFFLKGIRGVLKQHFYEDDPNTQDEDERDLDIPDSDFFVESQRFHLAATLRATF